MVRTVTRLDGSKIKVQRAQPSKEAKRALGLRSHIDIVGHIAINPPEIEHRYRLEKAKILRDMAEMLPAERIAFIARGPIDFVEDKTGLSRFEITCSTCGEKVAYCYAKNEKLEGWCDLHYLTWYDRTSWYGAATVNISPIDGKIGFECHCGEDTKDHRCTRGLPPVQRMLMIEYSMKHRAFGHSESKFIASEVI